VCTTRVDGREMVCTTHLGGHAVSKERLPHRLGSLLRELAAPHLEWREGTSKVNVPRLFRKSGPKVDNWLQVRSQISQNDPWDTPTKRLAWTRLIIKQLNDSKRRQ